MMVQEHSAPSNIYIRGTAQLLMRLKMTSEELSLNVRYCCSAPSAQPHSVCAPEMKNKMFRDTAERRWRHRHQNHVEITLGCLT